MRSSGNPGSDPPCPLPASGAQGVVSGAVCGRCPGRCSGGTAQSACQRKPSKGRSLAKSVLLLLKVQASPGSDGQSAGPLVRTPHSSTSLP